MVEEKKSIIYNFYVDEAGDLTLFNKKGQILVGNEGVSKYFMVGLAYIPNPELVKNEMEKLRRSLLADPYFKDVPSMNPQNKKTALLFHAKDDLPEVKREVFRLLPLFKAKIQVAIKRKSELALFAKQMFSLTNQKIKENEIYDDLIKRLFRNVLHKAQENVILFARRGVTNRNIALEQAIQKAKRNFEIAYNKKSDKPVKIFSAYSHESYGLQVIDYYLWALQRMYEKGEDRFFELVKNDYRLIMDLDDTRNKQYGEYYSDSNMLSLKKLKPD